MMTGLTTSRVVHRVLLRTQDFLHSGDSTNLLLLLQLNFLTILPLLLLLTCAVLLNLGTTSAFRRLLLGLVHFPKLSYHSRLLPHDILLR